jgi:hypothetical protein
MQCAEFEALLSEAVEGLLGASRMTEFRSHAADCQSCGVLFADALAGHKLLESLHQTEPPESLFEKVIAATSAIDPRMKRAAEPGLLDRIRLWMRPLVTPMLQPRIAGSMAMAFFSISVVLNIAGVKLSDLRHADLRPSAVRVSMEKNFYETRARVVRYYESVRWVYQVEAQLRQLRNAAQPENDQNQKREKKEKNHSDMSSQPGQEREQKYASEGDEVLAAWNRDKQMNVEQAVYVSPRSERQIRRQA